MDAAHPPLLPPLLSAFLLALVMSFLLGLGLREYYLVSKKTNYFGSTRTCTLLGILGLVLFRLQAEGWLYLAGLLALAGLLGLYYATRLAQQQPGLIGILIALLSYATGPIALTQPDWFVVLFTVSALFVLNAKERINRLTQTLGNEEIISLGKFLVLSGVILPLAPATPLADFIPVSFHQTWLAVVVISGISYLGYLIQTYVLQGQGVLLTGAIGGIYSSTATTVVLARQSADGADSGHTSAAAMVLATTVMYLRLLAVVWIFQPALGLALSPGFLGLAALGGGAAYWLQRGQRGGAASVHRPRNPLDLSSALLFALLFVAVATATQFAITHYAKRGLQWMAFFSGFADIDPFLLSLLQGRLIAQQPALLQAIVIATASNNLLKAVYALALAERRAGRLAGAALAGLALATLAYGLYGV